MIHMDKRKKDREDERSRQASARLRLMEERAAFLRRLERLKEERRKKPATFNIARYVATFDYATPEEKRLLAYVLRKAWEWGWPPSEGSVDEDC